MQRPKVILARFDVLAQGLKNSVHVDSADEFIELVGDTAAPGNLMVYGTNSSGIRGWQPQSSSIADGSITNAKLANEAQATLKGRAAGAGTGVPQDLSAAQVKTLLAIAGTDVANTPTGNIAATTVQAAINELDAEKQPLDSDLTQIAAIAASNDDIIQRKTGSWTNRTPAQLKSDLNLSKSDVGLGNVDNTADSAKPVSTAQAAADAAKVSKTGDSMTGPLAMGSNKITGGAPGTNSDDFVTLSQLATATRLYQEIEIGPFSAPGDTTFNYSGDLSKVRRITALIRADGSAPYVAKDILEGGRVFLNGSAEDNITFELYGSGVFDNAAYQGLSDNRGWITVEYNL